MYLKCQKNPEKDKILKICLKNFPFWWLYWNPPIEERKSAKYQGREVPYKSSIFHFSFNYFMYNFTRYYCEQNHNNSLKARRARIAAARKEEENARFSDWGIQSVPTSPIQHHSKLTLTNGLSTLSFKWSFMLRFKYTISNQQDSLFIPLCNITQLEVIWCTLYTVQCTYI